MYIYIHIYVYIYVYICTYIYICIHIQCGAYTPRRPKHAWARLYYVYSIDIEKVMPYIYSKDIEKVLTYIIYTV